jgi:hypothetical protein
VQVLKKSLRFFDRISALFVLLTGLYLTWYWYGAITDRGSDGVIRRVDSLQSSVVNFLNDLGAVTLGLVFAAVILFALWFIRRPTQQRS